MDKKAYQNIKISLLTENVGQVEGLPRNPRWIKDERYKALKKSIEDAPEFLDARMLLVYPHEGKYVVIAGNMRLKACKELGFKELPCYVFNNDTPVEKLREYAIKDNVEFGNIDWDCLANEWDTKELQDWGMDTDFLGDDWGGDINPDDCGDEFSLPDGDKKGQQNMTFTFSDEQADFVKKQIGIVDYGDEDTFGNTNKNGNALYKIVKEWADARTL